jgi:hypothetical protein
VKKRTFTTLLVFVCLSLAASAGSADIKDLFPKMEGWEPEGEAMIYTADNLFEYIDGSADLYLAYDFQEMGALNYFDDYGRNVLVEIYRFRDANDTFGMYSRERPRPVNVVEIGAEGYYDPGVLNFCQGDYYVKIQGYDLGEQDKAMLSAVAKLVSQNIGGDRKRPAVLECFPKSAKVKHSESYIARNLFGHEFLHSAFVAEYRSGGDTTTRGFIIEAKDDMDADFMLDAYVEFVQQKGNTVEDKGGVLRFTDPVSRTAGTLTVKKSGRYIWGLSTSAESTGAAYVADVEKNLKALQLIE